MVDFVKALFKHFAACNSSQKSSSLAYYTVFSILPMIMISVSILGLLFGEQAVQNVIFDELKSVIGSGAANQVQSLIAQQHTNHHSVITAIIGFVTLALSASGMLSQIHTSFNSIWEVDVSSKNSILLYVLTHLKSFLLLIILCLIMFASVLLSTFLAHYSSGLQMNVWLIHISEHLLTLLILCLVFSLMYKYLGDAMIPWKAALAGGFFTAILFLVGKVIIAMYIAHSHTATMFGTASFIVLILLWGYYISQIIFLGASFVFVVCKHLNYHINPIGKE
jgi:membrane protein